MAHGDADADRHGDGQALSRQIDRVLRDHAAQAARGHPRLGPVGVGQRDQEFLAADARDQVDRAQIGAQTLRHFDQDGIARGMAMKIVDPLEMVQIRQHHRETSPAAVGVVRHAHQVRQRIAAVVKTGQRVRHRRAHAVAQGAAQLIGHAFAPDLAGDPQAQFGRIEPPCDHIARAKIKRIRRHVIVRLGQDDHDGGMAGFGMGAQFRQKPQSGRRHAAVQHDHAEVGGRLGLDVAQEAAAVMSADDAVGQGVQTAKPGQFAQAGIGQDADARGGDEVLRVFGKTE